MGSVWMPKGRCGSVRPLPTNLCESGREERLPSALRCPASWPWRVCWAVRTDGRCFCSRLKQAWKSWGGGIPKGTSKPCGSKCLEQGCPKGLDRLKEGGNFSLEHGPENQG